MKFSKRFSIRTVTSLRDISENTCFHSFPMMLQATLRPREDQTPTRCHVCLPSWSAMHDVCVICAKKGAVAMNANVLKGIRLNFQPFCEPAFLAPHHGWITGLHIVFFDQSQPSLLKSSRLPCDWSIQHGGY